MIKFLDLQKQYAGIKNEIDRAVFGIIERSEFIGGKTVKDFENAFAEYQNAEFSVGVGNGTDALEIAIEALDLPKGSEIIVPANSFIASSEAVTRAGHRVVFCDCDKDNYTISTDSLSSKITEKTRAVVAVHLYGHPCDMDTIRNLTADKRIKIIEDCAQAHGAEYKGRKVGSIGDVGTFSFYPGKNLGAYGDGGVILTNDEQLAIKCRMIANHGRVKKYDHEFEGRNSRLDGMQAAVLFTKLKYLDEWTDIRISIADFYLDKLSNVDRIILPKREEWAKQVYHLFVIRVEDRDSLQKHLSENDISSGIHYPVALPKLQAYSYLGQDKEKFFANENDSKLLSIPIGDHLDIKDAEQVVEAIKGWADRQ